MDNPLVSIIIPCYNHEKYIEECVLSVINQTYKNIELIVVDDGSKDRSPEILKELQKQYGFTLVCQSNMGISKTLNKAIKTYAHGKYISYIASDDYMTLDKIKIEVDYLKSHPDVALVYGKSYLIDENSNIILEDREKYKKEVSFNDLLISNNISALTTMFRYSVFEELEGFNENTPIEDWDFWLRISYKYPIKYIDSYMGYYRSHGTNTSHNGLKIANAIFQILESWQGKVDKSLYRRAYRNASLNALRWLARNHKKDAIKHLKPDVYYFFDSRFYNGIFKLLFF